MRRKEYVLEFENGKQKEQIAKFLLESSNIVRFTQVEWYEGGNFGLDRKLAEAIKTQGMEKFGGKDDPKFIKTLKRLEPFFIKKITNNKKYTKVTDEKFTHYFYRLSPQMKKLINKETLFFTTTPPISKSFYGFENTFFFKSNILIGYVINHAMTVVLYLTSSEKQKLEKAGIDF